MVKRAASLFSIDVISPDADRRPAHRRVLERIQTAISSGALPVNARLPSSRTLARDLGLSRNTVDEALSCLVAEGLVVRHRGIGSFVSSSLPEPRSSPRTLDTQNCAGHFAANGAAIKSTLAFAWQESTQTPYSSFAS